MKRIILLGVFLLIFTSFISLNAQWARTYGGNSDDGARFICETSDGGYIVGGYTESFGSEERDFWILKLSSNGEIEWQKTYGGSNTDWGVKSIQQTDDGGYIAGGHQESFGAGGRDIWVLKLYSNGEIEWQKTYGRNNNDEIYSLQQTGDGGYIIAGFTRSFSAGNALILVIKLNSSGEIEWQKTYGGNDEDRGYSIQQTDDGGYIVSGMTVSFGAGWVDYLILKLSSIGEIEWQKTYGGSNFDWGHTILQTHDGGYIVRGSTDSFGAGQEDGWILKLTSSGDIEWQKTYGGSDTDIISSIQQTSDGGYIVAGWTHSFGAGEIDVWVSKLSTNGEIEWQRTYGGNGSDYARSIQLTSDGGYIVAGETSSGTVFSDILILKLLPNGDIQPSCGLIGSSDFIVSNTNITPDDTAILIRDTNIAPQDTSIRPQDTYANVSNPCETLLFTLTVSAQTGGTTEPTPNHYRLYKGTEVTVTAIPESGYEFSGWTGDVPSGHENDNPITITMDSDKSITANFNAIPTEEEDGKKGGCFIATAAYGSPLHPYVEILRDLRDKYLMSSRLGREVCNLYYKYSPYVAYLIAKHNVLKIAVRINLLPLVAFSYAMLHFGPAITVVMFASIFMLPIFLISFFKKKMRQLEAKDLEALASLD